MQPSAIFCHFIPLRSKYSPQHSVPPSGMRRQKDFSHPCTGYITADWFVSHSVPRNRCSNCLRAGRQRNRSSSPGRVKNFHFSISSRPALGPTQPPIHWAPGALSSGVKRQGREADHSPPTSAQVKKTWVYTSTSP
jgi:hypothetical protein